MTARIIDIRLLLLIVTIITYAAFSDPTPDQISWAELLMGGCLVALVGPGRGLSIASGARLVLIEDEHVTRIRNIAFVWLMLVPLVVGTMRSASATDLVRDLIPMLFLFLPLLVGETLESRDRRPVSVWLVRAASLGGLILALRHLLITQSSLEQIGEGFYSEHSLYLSTDSFVHFAAAYLLLEGFQRLVSLRLKSVVLAVGLILGGLFCLGVLALKGHRGPVILVIGVLFLFFVIAPGLGARMKFRVLAAGAAACIVAWLAYGDILLRLADLFLAKHEAVGISNRDAEFLAIVDIVFRDTFAAIFGLGFGSVYESPAASATVNFAHWIGGYVLLKAGLIGVILVILYFLTFFGSFLRLLRRESVLALGLIGPLLIGVTISGTYRFLSYGVLLTILHIAAKTSDASSQHGDK